MGLEYEHRYREFDKESLWKQLKDMYPHIKKEVHLLRNTIYVKSDNPELYIRIRDSGKEAFLTLKYHNGKYPEEYEISINDFKTVHQMLLMLGCQIKYVIEKIRETWDIPHGEIAFDQHPGLPEFMEIEMDSKKSLLDLEKKLNVKPELFGAQILYKDFYDIDERSGNELAFNKANKVIGTMVIKNKKMFKELLQEQRKIIKNLK